MCFLFSLFTLAKLAIVFATFAVYMIEFYVPLDFMEPFITKKMKLDRLMYRFPRSYHLIQNLIFCSVRTVLVIVTGIGPMYLVYSHFPILVIVALIIPNLNNLVGLIGAVASSPLLMIFPPLVHFLTFWDKSARRSLWFYKDVALICFGVVALIVGTGAALYNTIIFLMNSGLDDNSADICGNKTTLFQTHCHLVYP